MALYRNDPYQRLRDLAGGVDPSALPPPEEALLTRDQVAHEADRAYSSGLTEQGRAFNQGMENLRSTGYALRGLARVPFSEEGALRDFQRSQDISERAAEFGPKLQNFDQIEGVGDFGEWLANNTLTQLPNIAITLGTAGAGAAARAGVGTLARKVATEAAARSVASGVAARSAARSGVAKGMELAVPGAPVARRATLDELTDTARRRLSRYADPTALARDINQGAAVGAAVGGTGLQTSMAPDIVLDPNGEGSVRERAGVAAVGALVTGSMEVLPVMRLLGRYGGNAASKEITGNVIKRMTAHGVRQGATEATTELAQTFGEKLAHKYVNDNVQVLGPEAYSDYLNAAAGGFFGGAVFGAPAGLRGSGKAGPAYAKMREHAEAVMDKMLPDFSGVGKLTGPSPGGDMLASAPDSPIVPGAPGGAGRTFDVAKKSVDKVTEYYNRFFGAQSRESSIDDALDGIFNEIYSATPFDYKPTESGEVLYNRPFNNFADSARARASVAAGVPVDIAVVASTVPAAREASLSRSGALQAAAQVLRGDSLDSVDSTALRSYVGVLTPEARNSFIRAAATMQELAASDMVQRDEKGRAVNAQINTPPAEALNDAEDSLMSDYDVQENTSDPVDLRDPKKTYTEMMKGLPAGMAAQRKPDSIPVMDKNGKPRYATPAKLGQMLTGVKADPEFVDATRNMNPRERNVAAIAQLASEVAMGGGNLDLTTLRAGMELGKGWKLLPADVAAINNAVVAGKYAGGSARARTATLPLAQGVESLQPAQATPNTSRISAEYQANARQRENALNREAIGSDDYVQEQRGEANPSDEDAKLGPRAGVPRTLPEVSVKSPGEQGQMVKSDPRKGSKVPLEVEDAKSSTPAKVKVTDAPTIDSKNDIDKEALKVERDQYESGPFADLDRLIERHTGKKVNGDFERRDELYAHLLSVGKTVTTSPANNYIVNGEVRRGAQKRRTRQLGPNERRELVEARRAFVEASHTAAEKKLRETTAHWQKLRKELADAAPEARQGVAKRLSRAKKARDKAEYAVDTLADEIANFEFWSDEAQKARTQVDKERSKRDMSSTKTLQDRVNKLRREKLAAQQKAQNAAEQAREKTRLEELAAQKAAEADNSSESAANERKANTAESIHNEIPKTTSRRELDALAQRIVYAKGISETRRLELLEMVVARRAELVDKINRAARAEYYHRRNEDSQERFEALRKALEGKTTLLGALNAVRTHGTRAQNRLIDTLVQMGSLRGVAFSNKPLSANPVRQGSARGSHTSSASKKSLDGVVTLNIADTALAGNNNTDILQVLLHEAIHAATTHAELVNPAIRNDVKAMLAHAVKMAPTLGIDPDQWYGMSETQEFLAEAFTNPDFQRLLAAMPPANTGTFKSLWDQFKGFIAKLLGVQGKDASLLDEVFTVGTEMARRTAEARTDRMLAELGLADGSVEYSAEGAQSFDMVTTPVSGGRPTDFVNAIPPKERLRLLRAFSRPDVRRIIEAAVPQNMRHVLNSADRGPTLFLNTGIALGLAGKLPLNRAQSSSMRQLGDAIRNTLQLPSSTTYANQILRDLRAGETVRPGYSSRTKLITPAANSVFEFFENKVAPLVQAIASDMDERMRDTGVPALTELATLISQRTGEFRADQGTSFLARRNRERAKRLNDFYKIIEGWDDKKKAEITRALQAQAAHVFSSETDKNTGKTVFEEVTGDAKKVLDFYKDMASYMTDSGLKFGKIMNYFPVSIDGDTVAKNKDDFIALMSAPEFAPFVAAHGGAEGLYQAALTSTTKGEQTVGGVTFGDGKHNPKLRPLNQRLSAFVYKHGTEAQKEAFAKFQDPNLERITVNYINRAVTRAEWTRLDLGTKIDELRAKAVEQGATPKQMQVAEDYVDQAMGVYGQDWHPGVMRVMQGMDNLLGTKLADTDFNKVKGLQSALLTYQNLRLLPLALASSLIDPLGSAVRSGGKMGGHFQAMREAARAIRENGPPSALRDMARDMGIIERNAVNEALAYMFGGAHDPSGRMAKINNALFKANGLELVTKYSRLTALSLGHKFILQHALKPGKHSERYLRELGLTAADVKPDGRGYVVRNAKIDAALWRFVDESVVRPTPTQRPGWHNDPHFALAAQYKGYLYSFWNTVMRRVATELKNGNYRALAPIALYLPVTMVGEMLRDGLQADDDDREMWDYATLSVERSGILGPKMELLASAHQDRQYGGLPFNSLSGPTAQQMSNLYSTVAGQRSASKTAIEALPGSALFEDWTL